MLKINRLVLLFVCICAGRMSFASQHPEQPSMGQLNTVLQELSEQPYQQDIHFNLPSRPVLLPRQGEKNTFGIFVTVNLQAAYDAFQLADGKSALVALQRYRSQLLATDNLAHWYSQLFEAQVLVMMGRAADAESFLKKTRILERQLFKQTVFADVVQGEAWMWLGEHEQAKRMFLNVAQALQNWRASSANMMTTKDHDLAYKTTAQLRAYTGLANIAQLNGELEQARAWAARAEAHYADFHYMANQAEYSQYARLYADSYYARAANLTLLGASSPIPVQTGFFDQADAFYTAQAYQPGLASNLAYRAYAALQAGATKQAMQFAKKAAGIAQQTGLTDLMWRVQAMLGEVHLKNGQDKLAEQSFRHAQAAVDVVNGSLSNNRAGMQFDISKAEITARLLDFDMKANNAGQLFEDAERGRARAFVDLLTDTELGLSDDAKTNQLVRNLDENIRNLRLKQSLQSTKAGLQISAEMNELIAQRERLLDNMAATNSEWAAAYTVRYAKLKQLQQRLGKEALLVYSFAGTKTDDLNWMFVQGNEIRIVSIPKGQTALNKALIKLTDGVALGDESLQQQALEAISKVLGLTSWPTAKQVYVVPSGQLHFVPWAALGVGQWVSVLPNGSWLLRVARNKLSGQGQLVVGDPDFGGDLPQLPGARQEAVAVAEHYNIKPLLAKDATVEGVRKRSQKRLDVLHFATHGMFNYSNPLLSSLYFSSSDGGAQAMTASDIFRHPVRADLLVLSACETGLGQVQPDNDVLGLLRSFYMNGASSAVNTLWPVSDQKVQNFMQVFHSNLNLGAGKALSKAVADSKAAGLPPSVYAAFVLNGYTETPATTP